MTDTSLLARKLFELVQKHDWTNWIKLTDEENQVLVDVLNDAGFNIGSVTQGRLKGDYRAQDGSATGQTYPINTLSPFKALSQDGKDNYHATGWLDRILRIIYRSSNDAESIIERVSKEIERSRPLEPIQLTPEGDMLREYPPSGDFLVSHTRDENDLRLTIGVHMHCEGWMEQREATATHKAIICRACYLRVLFPKEVETYGALRDALAPRIMV